MKYWYGIRVIELDGSNPGHKLLSSGFSSYEKAKADRQRVRARDMEQTAVFRAENQVEAEELMHKEQFSRL